MRASIAINVHDWIKNFNSLPSLLLNVARLEHEEVNPNLPISALHYQAGELGFKDWSYHALNFSAYFSLIKQIVKPKNSPEFYDEEKLIIYLTALETHFALLIPNNISENKLVNSNDCDKLNKGLSQLKQITPKIKDRLETQKYLEFVNEKLKQRNQKE